jgi:predicted ATP-dependent serine protease
MKALRWLWQGRIALGKITLLAGNPGLGKSQITIGIAAATTTGGKYADGSRAPTGSVVFISCEDDYADTVIPRLVAAGADLDKVHVLNWALDEHGTEKHFDVGAHCASLVELCDKLGDVRLVVIDPITAYCGDADTHKTSDVRQALAPLQTLAAEKGVAVLAVSHLNKSASGDPVSRVSGSIAFGAVARSVLLVVADPADDSGRRRYLAPIKNNLGDDKTGFAFSVESVTLPGGIETSRVVFESGTVELAAGELLQAQNQSPEERSQLEEAMDLLSDVLSEGPVLRKTVEKKAREADVSDITLKRARAKLRIKHKKMKGTGEYVLCLPQHVGQLAKLDQVDQPDHVDHEIGT